jgi:hypothetical protein
MDLLQKQKLMMLAVIVILTATAAYFFHDRMKITEIDKNYSTKSLNDIHRQTLPVNSIEYKTLKKSIDRLMIYQKSIKISEGENKTLFYSVHNEQPISTTFWLSNVECNDGSTQFFNPKYEAFENMVLMQNSTMIFPLRIFYPKTKFTGPTSFNCKVHISSGISEYASENIIIIFEPKVTK